ncbi:hypothetical protein ACIBIZ_23690 [Nonomuraea spiralis]|uniref:hypothetical protein n=1 Tax=Nonomuraea spiralis TaxID=46182 RepID=UPI0037B67C3A
MNPPSSAYVDESMLYARGVYLMAAVLVARHQADRYRDELRALLLRRQLRVHWRDENDKRRNQIIERVAALRPSGVIVVGAGLDPKRQERSRGVTPRRSRCCGCRTSSRGRSLWPSAAITGSGAR